MKWRAYFELLRLPAVFTAVADVMMGYLVTQGDLRPVPVFLLLVAASSCLYLAGMVLNDFYDAEVDARDRPKRPIPSGRISLQSAARLGWGLLACGVGLFWLLGARIGLWEIGFMGTVLAGAIWVYDSSASKHASAAPLVMGLCRAVNVTLAMGVADSAMRPDADWRLIGGLQPIVLGVLLYIAGVTWFAQSEATASKRRALIAALTVLLLGLAIIATSPLCGARIAVQLQGWWLLWAVLALLISRRCVVAIVQPTPRHVQAAVRHCLRSIIVIDAAVVLGFCGIYWGCAVLLLLAPMLLLEQLSSTT